MRRSQLVGAGFLAVVILYAVGSARWVGADAGWYEALPKPPWQPPDWVFGVIWPLNFLALVVAGLAVARADAARALRVLGFFAVSVVLAVGWAYLFYVPHALTGSALALAAAAIVTWLVLVLTYRIRSWAGLILIPYAAWVTLATSLAAWYAVEIG
jgi:benzodiazapine receptor